MDIDYENLRNDPFLFNKVQDCEQAIREGFSESPTVAVSADIGADVESHRVVILSAASKVNQNRVLHRRFSVEELEQPQTIGDSCREMFTKLLFG